MEEPEESATSKMQNLADVMIYLLSAAAEAPKTGGYRQPNTNICLHV